MKLKYTLLLIAALVTGLLSCKKGSNSAPIVGKWQETKIRMYELNNASIVYDTTYFHPFTSLDYVQFNADGTANFSSDHYYYPNQYGYPTTPQAIDQLIDTLTYTSTGNKYILNNTNQPLNYSGFILTDTAYVTGNTLLIRFINYGISNNDGHQDVTDSYYTR